MYKLRREHWNVKQNIRHIFLVEIEKEQGRERESDHKIRVRELRRGGDIERARKQMRG